MNISKQLIVAVSGINASDNPGPGVGVARSLKEAAAEQGLDIKIVGLAYDAMEPGLYMDWLIDKAFIMPYPSHGGDIYLERLLDIKRKHGLDFIIPSLDVELPLFIKYASTLEQFGIKTFLPDMRQFQLRSKDRLQSIADNIEARLPETRIVGTHDQLFEAIHDIGFPVMLKGLFYKAHRVVNFEEAVTRYDEIMVEWGAPVIVQEMIAGDELNVIGLGDGQGNALGLVGVKKICLTPLGKIWTGVTVKHEPMLDAAMMFIKQYQWRGPFELECIVKGDNIFLVEINPRFPAWVYFATGVGVNLPMLLLQHGLGRPVEPQYDYEPGKFFVRYTYDMVTTMNPLQTLITTGETS